MAGGGGELHRSTTGGHWWKARPRIATQDFTLPYRVGQLCCNRPDGEGRVKSIDAASTYDALGRRVERYQAGAYLQIVRDPLGFQRAYMSGQTLLWGFQPLPNQVLALYDTTLNQTLTYYDTGKVRTSTEPNAAQTTDDYVNGSCPNSLLSRVTPQISSLTQSFVWSCAGGVITSATGDANSSTTSWQYADPNYWRPTGMTDPTSAQTVYSYATSPIATQS